MLGVMERPSLALKLAAVAAVVVTAGCPSTSPSGVSISEVRVGGDPTSNDYTLHILGRGFGLESFTYDLASQEGSVRPQCTIQIFDSVELVNVGVEGDEIQILSPFALDARVRDRPLPPGVYGIRLFAGGSTEPAVIARELFRVGAGDDDGGVPAGDGGAPVDPADGAVDGAVDGGPIVRPDGGPLTGPDGQVLPDAAPIDAGVPDTGVPPDSGLGPFEGAFQFRQEVRVENLAADVVPAGTTLRIPIDHALLAGSMRSKVDASDLALYYGATRLEHQWDDEHAVATNGLVMIARLPVDAPVGALTGAGSLILYYGDPNLTVPRSNEVFEVVERFDANLGGAWAVNTWERCNYARPLQMQTAAGQGGAQCVEDDNDNPTRRTLGSPNYNNLVSTLAATQTYEVGLWIAARMESQSNDLLYFAYGPDSDVFANTTLIPAAAWTELPPNVAGFGFTETNGGQRLVEGWRFPAGAIQWWTRARAPFKPVFDGPSLHLRFISADGNDNGATVVIIDDLQVRLAAQPELAVTLGDVDVR